MVPLKAIEPRDTRLMTVKDAARYLGVSIDTIYDGCKHGGLKHVRLGKATIRLRREWLDDWVEAQATKPKA